MRRVLLHIISTAAAVAFFCTSCDRDGAEVIPRNQLAQIYAEMFVTDQWVMSAPGVRMIADTSLVYQPILEKYGYDIDDYMRTVDVYMNDPERFAKIFRTSAEILDGRILDLKARKEEQDRQRERAKRALKYKSDFKPEEFFPYMADEPYVHYYDSIGFEPDSVLMVYRLIPVERGDTIYDRIRMIIKSDTTAVVSETPESVEEPVSEQFTEPVKKVSTGILKDCISNSNVQKIR